MQKKIQYAIVTILIGFLLNSCSKESINETIQFSLTDRYQISAENRLSRNKLLNISSLDEEIKNGIDFSQYKFYRRPKEEWLWVFSLKNGTLGFSNAKVAVSLQDDKFSMILISFDFDRSKYKKGDFTTYTGTTSIYNSNLRKTKDIVYKNGKIIKIISAPYIVNVIPYTPSDLELYHNWCAEFPALCGTAGSGNGGSDIPPAEGFEQPGDGGGGYNDPFSPENLTEFANQMGKYWEDPSYDNVPFPAYDPNVDGPRNQDGYRKNGPPYTYADGVVQNYTNDNGGKYAIFTSTNGAQTTFPGATITDFLLSPGYYGVTTANGGIHISTGYGLKGLQHEYGHYLQAQAVGVAYYYGVIVPASLKSAITNGSNHRSFWTEKNANQLAIAFFGSGSAIAGDPSNYPR